jgi:3-hydroxymyristoyl/3-hydroxydecanoyl-(acyl carrier protein) dehydratase
MIETVAHLASVFYESSMRKRRFMAFAGVDAVKFREAVYPPAELLIIARAKDVKPRRLILESQILKGETLVFEGQVTGMLLDPPAAT